MPRITLYNALNGLSTLVDCGTGLRAKSWIDSLPMWLKESVEPTALAGLGLGRLANFPAVLDGSRMAFRPMGEALQTPTFVGCELFKVVRNTLQVGIGNAAATIIPGNVALAVPDPSVANYAVAGAAGAPVLSGSVVVPNNGVGYPAQMYSNLENYNLAATTGVLTVNINGVNYTAAVGVGAATTAEAVIAAIQTANWPCRVTAVINAGAIDGFRLTTLDSGAASFMAPGAGAGDAAAVIFAAEIVLAAGARRGWGGPLNDGRAASAAARKAQIPGARSQWRILPGSVTLRVNTALGVLVDTVTDNRAGVLSNLAGTSLGTIAYATGATVCTWAAAPAALALVTARFGALEPVDLAEPVRVSEINGGEFAIRLLP